MATKRDPYLYCHDCKRWVATIDDDHGGFTCNECGETILCDECGQPFTFGPEHVHAQGQTFEQGVDRLNDRRQAEAEAATIAMLRGE